VGQFATKIF